MTTLSSASDTAGTEPMNVVPLVEIRDLKVHFHTDRGVVRAVDGVDLAIYRGKVMGVVGESGCGKSVMSYSIMRLVPEPPGRIQGSIIFNRDLHSSIELTALDPRGSEIRSIRGGEISMIFQEPMTSLNPVYTVGHQIMETLRLHQGLSKLEARERATVMLDMVGIPDPAKRIANYPHQMSGGMRQRVMIAMALACNPALLIADEPTTALDVTIQAQILEILKSMQEKLGMAIMLITHDLGVIAEMADDVAVMYLGQIVEQASVQDVLESPLHPYTKGLINSVPKLGTRRREPLESIPGTVPDARFIPSGCRFRDRCSQRHDACYEEPPVFRPEPDHAVKCWLYR